MIEVTIDPDDARRIDELIDRISRVVEPSSLFTFLKDESLPYLRARAANRFITEGDDASGKWRPLTETSERFRAWAARKYGLPIKADHPINRRTGQLKNWVMRSYKIEQFGYAGAQLQMPGTRSSDRWLEQKYRHAQQGGFTRWYSGFGPRPVMAINQRDNTAITSSLKQWLEEQFEDATR